MSNADHASELLRQGITAAKAGRKAEARELLMQVVELDEENEQAWLWLSGVVETAKDRRICLENVLTLNPDNAHAQAGLAWLDEHAPPPPAAPAEVEVTMEVEEPPPQDPPALMEAAERHQEAGDAQQAIDLLTQVVELQPMNAEAYLRLGDARRRAGQRDAARQHYENARRLTSANSGLGQEARHKLAEMERMPASEVKRARAKAARADRPGCVTLYAVLAALGGLFGLLGACGTLALAGSTVAEMEEILAQQGIPLAFSAEQLTSLILAGAAVSLVFSVAYLAIAVGLWRMKNWARWAVVAVQALGLLGGVAQAATSILSTRQALAVYGVESVPVCYLGGFLVGFLIQAYIIFWFVANGDRFT